MSQESRLRIAVLADGQPLSPTTNSGVSRAITSCLLERPDVDVVATCSVAFPRVVAAFVRAASLRLSKKSWDRATAWGLLRPLARSALRTWRLKGIDRSRVFTLHVRNYYYPSRYYYAAFLDTTLSLRARDWPEPGVLARHYRLLEMLEKWYLSKAAIIFTAGRYVKDEIVDRYGIPPDRIHAVGAGINYDVVAAEKRKPKSKSDIRLLFVGKEETRKGLDILLEAFTKLSQVRSDVALDVVGLRCPHQFDASSMRIQFHGPVHNAGSIRGFYADADIFVLPARFEPFGLVVLEALASGVPCIVSNVGALPELVGNAGLVLDRNTPEELTARLLDLASDSETRARMAEAAHQRASGVSWGLVADRMICEIEKFWTKEVR